jgi:hypothetical protein
MRYMVDELLVIPEELWGASTGWHLEAAELHAVPPSLAPAGGWPTMLASAAVTGAAHAATADLHGRITTTAGATQVASIAYQAGDSNAADTIKGVISTVTDTVRKNT